MNGPEQHSPARLERQAAGQLKAAGIAGSFAEAGLLLQAATGLSRSELLLLAGPLDPRTVTKLNAMVARRVSREPLQYITGTAHFYGLELKADSRALIPRPETERLVELGLQRLSGLAEPRVVDVATGSGAIALAIKAEHSAAQVLASDLSADALQLAAENAGSLGLAVEFRQADLLQGLEPAAGRADLIVSNPPYLPDGDRQGLSPEVQRDPELALFAGADGLAVYRRLLEQAGPLLKSGAWLLVELDPRNVRQAAAAAAAYGTATTAADLTGRERFMLLQKK